MNRVEYTDVYRFTVSVGIAAIGAAILIPWLFLKDPFDFLITNSQLRDLPTESQAFIAYRRHMVSEIIHLVPAFSAVLFVLGIALIAVGIRKWLQKQRVSDEQERLTLEKLKQDLKVITPREVVEKVNRGLTRDEAILQPDVLKSREELVQLAVRTEKTLGQKLAKCFEKYKLLQNRRFKNTVYDAILVSERDELPDFVFEFKFLPRINEVRLIDSWIRTIMATQIYVEHTNRRAHPVLLVVAPRQTLDAENIDQLKLNTRAPEYEHAILEFIALEDLENLSCADLRRILEQSSE